MIIDQSFFDGIIAAANSEPREEGIPVGGEHEKRPHQVYLLADAEGNALYVGISQDVKRRLNEHRCQKEWWPEVADVHTTEPMPWADALRLEQHEIQTRKPKHNRYRTNGSLAVQAGVREIIAKERAEYRADRARRKAEEQAALKAELEARSPKSPPRDRLDQLMDAALAKSA